MSLIRLKYDEIYDEVNELRSFIEEEIIIKSQESYNEIKELISEMDGKTNAELYNVSNESEQKNNKVSKSLLIILDFIKTSTAEMEKEDKRISVEIEKRGE